MKIFSIILIWFFLMFLAQTTLEAINPLLSTSNNEYSAYIQAFYLSLLVLSSALVRAEDKKA